MKYNTFFAKTHLSQLVEKALTGEEVVIAKSGKPLVKLVPIENPEERKIGMYEGQIIMSEDFNSPLPDEIINEFYK